VYAQTSAYLLTALIAMGVVIKKASFKRLNWNMPFFILIIRQSFPFAILILLMTFYNRIDPVMIERLLPEKLGEEQAGIYASAYRLLDASNMIAYLFSVLLLPLFSRMIKNRESVVHVVKLAATLLIIISSIVAFASHFYSYELMDLLYIAHVKESSEVFRLLMFGYIAISTTYVFGTLLTANGNLKTLNIVAGSGMVINLVLNFVLVPRFYALGSAYASLMAQFLTAIAQVILVKRIFNYKINVRFLSMIFVFVAGLWLISYFSRMLFDNWMYNIAVMLVSSLLLAMALGLLNVKGFIQILRSKEP
jgi:O-antigen/teichoic acid export membrane protein